jgi:hypothetical protein
MIQATIYALEVLPPFSEVFLSLYSSLCTYAELSKGRYCTSFIFILLPNQVKCTFYFLLCVSHCFFALNADVIGQKLRIHI